MYTRKHYVQMAGRIKSMMAENPMMAMRECEYWAGVYASDNPRFDRYRFKAACGV